MSRRYESYGNQGPRVDAIRLWAGGVATAFVAAGIVVVGLLIAHILSVHVVSAGTGTIDVNTGWYAIVAAAATLVATGLMYLLLVSDAPRPELLFSAIMGIVTALAVLVPFTSTLSVQSEITIAAINLAVGIAVIALISGIGKAVANQQRSGAGQQPSARPYRDPYRDPYGDTYRDYPYRR